MHRKPYLITLLFIGLSMYSCAAEQRNTPEVISFDISPNEKTLTVEYYTGTNYELRIVSLENGNSVTAFTQNNPAFYSIAFSTDGTSVFYVVADSGNRTSNVFMYDLRTKSTQQVTKQSDLITDLLVDSSGKNLIYVKSNEFKKYSPIGIAAPHGDDLYKYNLYTKEEQKITNLYAYRIAYLSRGLTSNNIFCKIITPSLHTMAIVNINSTDVITPINPVNNPSVDSTLHSNLCMMKSTNTYFFTTVYELFVMDTTLLEAKKIFRPESGYIVDVKVMDKSQRLVVQGQSSTELIILDINGRILQKIEMQQ